MEPVVGSCEDDETSGSIKRWEIKAITTSNNCQAVIHVLKKKHQPLPKQSDPLL
jgi:hypothetical protein